MAKIKLNGDTSGYIEISAPAVSGNNTLELGPGTKILTNLDNTFTGVSTFSSDVYLGNDIYLTDGSSGYEKVEVGANDIRVESKHVHSEFGVWTRSSSLSDRRNGIDGDNNDLRLYSNSTEKVRITSAGDVGIGTNAPTTGNPSGAKFIHIHNSATNNSNSPAEIYFTNANTGPSGGAGGMITFYDTGFYFWNYANDDLHFGTGGNERFKFDHSANTLDFVSTSKIRLKGANSNGTLHAHLNIGSDGAGSTDTRAIDIWGNWSDQESKSITWNHGTGTSDMVCQQRVRYNSSPSTTVYEIGRLYNGQNTTAFPFQLQSSSTTTADLTIDGNILHKTAAFAARSTTSNDITSSTRSKIDYTVDYNYQGVFNNTNDRFTAQKSGLYFFYARHWFGSNSSGTIYMDWLKNGSLVKEFRVTHPSSSGEYETIQGSGMLYMSVNDYLEVYGRSDGNGVFHESNGGAYSEFSGFYVSGS